MAAAAAAPAARALTSWRCPNCARGRCCSFLSSQLGRTASDVLREKLGEDAVNIVADARERASKPEFIALQTVRASAAVRITQVEQQLLRESRARSATEKTLASVLARLARLEAAAGVEGTPSGAGVAGAGCDDNNNA